MYSASGLNRQQAIFDNILGNYIETMWIQKTQGLMDDETWESFEGLLKRYAGMHHQVFEIVLKGSNYGPKLQRYLTKLFAEVDASTEAAER